MIIIRPIHVALIHFTRPCDSPIRCLKETPFITTVIACVLTINLICCLHVWSLSLYNSSDQLMKAWRPGNKAISIHLHSHSLDCYKSQMYYAKSVGRLPNPFCYIGEKYWKCLCGYITSRAKLSSTSISWSSTVVSCSMCWVWGDGMWVWCVWGGRRYGL